MDHEIRWRETDMVTSDEMMQVSNGWIRILNKMSELEKTPRDYGSGDLLYGSEIHTIMAIGQNQDINVTSLASSLGISKSAVSQMIARLAEKNLVERFRSPDNDKETRMRLTPRGRIAYLGHEQHHAIIFSRMQEKLGDITADQYTFLMRVIRSIEETAGEFVQSG